MNAEFRFIPHEASTIAGQVDGLTSVLLILCGFIVVLVSGLIIVFGVLYRKGSPRSRKIDESGYEWIEWGWTIATFFIFLGLFGWAALLFFKMHFPPVGASEIRVVGKQWMWKFQHPNGKRELNELHIPVNIPILLTMTSEDVIHSFFVPEFRVKQDVLPGRYSRLWFEATRLGEYHLFCTQYCGTLHAGMRGKVKVVSQSEYQRWLQSGVPSGTLMSNVASKGQSLYTRLGCMSCHGVNPGVRAPSLHGIFGKPVNLSDGTSVLVDENYIRESILNPKAKMVQGYESIMPSYAGLVSEEDILDLIAYLKSLQSTPQKITPEGPKTTLSLPQPPPLSPGRSP